MVLAVYSSGSVPAQQLLYGYSSSGDLRPLFRHWFDTRSGGKHEASSYQGICAQMGVAPRRVLFVSDAPAELAAASTAGLHVVFSLRPANPHQKAGPYPAIRSFADLQIS